MDKLYLEDEYIGWLRNEQNAMTELGATCYARKLRGFFGFRKCDKKKRVNLINYLNPRKRKEKYDYIANLEGLFTSKFNDIDGDGKRIVTEKLFAAIQSFISKEIAKCKKEENCYYKENYLTDRRCILWTYSIFLHSQQIQSVEPSPDKDEMIYHHKNLVGKISCQKYTKSDLKKIFKSRLGSQERLFNPERNAEGQFIKVLYPLKFIGPILGPQWKNNLVKTVLFRIGQKDVIPFKDLSDDNGYCLKIKNDGNVSIYCEKQWRNLYTATADGGCKLMNLSNLDISSTHIDHMDSIDNTLRKGEYDKLRTITEWYVQAADELGVTINNENSAKIIGKVKEQNSTTIDDSEFKKKLASEVVSINSASPLQLMEGKENIKKSNH